MREIKFRAWDKYSKIWLGCPIQRTEEYNGFKIIKELPSIEIMQFTGLKDKNGKEIYEGDIVKRSGGLEPVGKIIWLEENFAWGVRFIYNPPTSLDLYSSNELEVIGNKFENPELLESMKNERSKNRI